MYIGTFYSVIIGKINLDVFTEPTGVIIPDSFTITKSFKQGITAEYPILNLMLAITTQSSKNLHTIFSGLRLTSATFPRNNNSLLSQ